MATSLEYAKLNDDVPMVTVFTSGHVAREELRKPSCCYGDRPLVLGASREELGRLHPPGDQIRPCLLYTSDAADDYELARGLERFDGFCCIGFRVDVVVQRSSIEEERVVAQERMADGRGRLRELRRRRVARQDEQRCGLERVHCRRMLDAVLQNL